MVTNKSPGHVNVPPSLAFANPNAAKPVAPHFVQHFPCLEQPTRVALRCNNGYYLSCLRDGRVKARQKQAQWEEFCLSYHEGGIVEITSHKFGGKLSVADVVETQQGNTSSSSRQLICVKEESEKEQEDENAEESSAHVLAISDTTRLDRQWCFVRAATQGQRDQVFLQSLRTGENLGLDSKGNVVFIDSDNPYQPSGVCLTWDVVCVTGELCFLSNPWLDERVRCDMAGLVSLTPSWKGWEVFRLVEAGHGHVRISSWMHSQWFLCSTEEGTVTTCSHAESFGEEKACSQWTIQRAESSDGVIIRSKTHERLLSVCDGVLCTVDPHVTDESKADEFNQDGTGNWWKSSVKGMKSSMKNVQNHINGARDKPRKGEATTPYPKDSLVWQLEAAHLQTYYFLTTPEDGELPQSIGPFPKVTPNLRKTEKIRLVREDHCVTRLLNTETKQYITCSANGRIDYTTDETAENAAWIMEKPPYQEGGSVFRSKLHQRYLSYEKSMVGEEVHDESDDSVTTPTSAAKKGISFDNLFRGKKDIAELVGTETMGMNEVWTLQPCMPRAVSSDKIKTLAIGTSIAVGTTIAMPFALAGASAVLGVMGAEAGLLFNAVAVTLTGAEAIASVGAIGATAYMVFRPEDNSLTDDHKNDEQEEAERAWSKRPFSDWRNW